MNLFDAFHDELEKIALSAGLVQRAARSAGNRATKLRQAAGVMPTTGTAKINPRNIPGSSVPGGSRSFPPPAYQTGPGSTASKLRAASAERKRQERLFSQYASKQPNPYLPGSAKQVTPSTRKVSPSSVRSAEAAAGKPASGSWTEIPGGWKAQQRLGNI